MKQNRSKKEANNNVNNNDKENINDTINDKQKANSNTNVTKKENTNNNLNISGGFSFSDFWNMYNKKVGEGRCEFMWNKLTNDEKALIKLQLPAYIKATEDDIKYRKDPYTWLLGKHWLDEHIPVKKKSAFEILAETGSYE